MSANTNSKIITPARVAAPAATHTHTLPSSIAQPTCSDDNNAYTATTKVLNVPELFQHILINTDTRTLLLAQRVSRAWKATIDGSSALQIKLFFRPATDAQAVNICLEHESMFLHGVIREERTKGYAVSIVPVVLSQRHWLFLVGVRALAPASIFAALGDPADCPPPRPQYPF